ATLKALNRIAGDDEELSFKLQTALEELSDDFRVTLALHDLRTVTRENQSGFAGMAYRLGRLERRVEKAKSLTTDVQKAMKHILRELQGDGVNADRIDDASSPLVEIDRILNAHYLLSRKSIDSLQSLEDRTNRPTEAV